MPGTNMPRDGCAHDPDGSSAGVLSRAFISPLAKQ
jgi:hypothetical protein